MELSHIHLAVMEHFCEVFHANYLAHGIQQPIPKIQILNPHNFFPQHLLVYFDPVKFFKLKHKWQIQAYYNYFGYVLKIGFDQIKTINKS